MIALGEGESLAGTTASAGRGVPRAAGEEEKGGSGD